MDDIEQGWRTRFGIYCLIFFIIVMVWKHCVGDSQWLTDITVFIVLYAFAQLILAWKMYLDSSDTITLLTEIRDFLKEKRSES